MDVAEDWLALWAKSVRDPANPYEPTHWLSLQQHLDDTEGVAGRLVDEWVPYQVLDRVGEDLPDGRDGVRLLACWLAAIHDVGKSSPAFCVQVRALADHARDHGFPSDWRWEKDPMRSVISHARVGHRAARDWLHDQLGFPARTIATQLACVVGGHHGVPPDSGELREVLRHPHLAGTGPWQEAREHILARATERAGGRAALAAYRDVVLSTPSQALLTAIVIMADWIASSDDLFDRRPVVGTLDEPSPPPDDAGTAERVARAWAELKLPSRWQAAPVPGDPDALFRARFGRPHDPIRPVQRAAVETARTQRDPGMIVIEAPMGSGKTEAALLSAETLAHRSGAGGCFVALPTQATSDAMFSRVHQWLLALPQGQAGRVPVTLAHGKAHLNEDFQGLVRRGRFSGIDEGDSESVVAHHWLSGRKKGPLAAFTVGTIDQVLFGALKSRHLVLRHLALAGKVVIIDEVHAYDVYMAQYLYRVLSWLGAYRVPVVLLSATLPPARRVDLLHAYQHGRGEEPAEVDEDPGYPVVLGSGGVEPRSVDPPAAGEPVRLDRLPDELDELVAYLRDALAEGGCAAIVRNTVGRVQETADRLADEFGAGHVTVDHSRFLSCDRYRIDTGLVRRFGPPGEHTYRPAMHIVVASQVVEQSLDVDFDLLVTDLAPVDLVLQRMGRMHRHTRDRPAPLAVPRCVLVGVEDWDADPVRPVAGSRAVYGEDTLLRSAALLRDRDTVALPADIAPLVRSAYGGEPLGPASWQHAMTQAAEQADERSRKRVENAKTFRLGESTRDGNLVGWIRGGVGDAEDTRSAAEGAAEVRDGGESLEVLVVQRDADGGLLIPGWITDHPGDQIPTDQPIDSWRARTLTACSLRLPYGICHPGVIDDVIAALEQNRFPSFEATPLLKGQLVLALNTDRTAVVEHGATRFQLSYDPNRGLTYDREI